jgi:hypothetical protein
MDYEHIKDRGLFIATPMYQNSCAGTYADAMVKLATICGEHKIKFQFETLFSAAIVPVARNYLVHLFLQSDCEHLLFWDADVAIMPENILALMTMQANHPEADIIGGAYPFKQIEWDRVAQAARAGVPDAELKWRACDYPFQALDASRQIASATRPCEVDWIPNGMMMIRRSVFERFDARHAPDSYIGHDRQPQREYFKTRTDPVTGQYAAEDITFCRMAREAGARVWLAPWMRLSHTGTMTFYGSVAMTVSG